MGQLCKNGIQQFQPQKNRIDKKMVSLHIKQDQGNVKFSLHFLLPTLLRLRNALVLAANSPQFQPNEIKKKNS
jgi:hypothetical protein